MCHDSFAKYLLALSHLVDLADTESVWEMAGVVMDKIFVTIALNSFRGVFGSTHGRTLSPSVKGGLLEPTSGIARLMWGTGIFNHHIAGTVSMACSERYELPSMVSDIAGSLSDEMWSRERHAVHAANDRDQSQLSILIRSCCLILQRWRRCTSWFPPRMRRHRQTPIPSTRHGRMPERE